VYLSSEIEMQQFILLGNVIVQYDISWCVFEWVVCVVLGCGLLACMAFKASYARLSLMICSVTYGNQFTWTKLFRHYCSTCRMLGMV